jgi:adenylate cyclase
MAHPRRLAAIMFTDMVGYSALAQADEATALGVLDRHNRLLRPIFPRFRGREVKTVGDAFLVDFDSALDATECAIEIQRTLHDYNESAPDHWKIWIRVGLHVGDVVQSQGDVLGDAVNIASRIAPLADPGGICLTQQVYDQVQNKIELPLVKLPPHQLKHIRLAVGVYKVVQPWQPQPETMLAVEPVSGHHIAVLPLANISPDPTDEYFAEGLTEELISVLSQVRGLSVIARTSIDQYRTAPKSIAQVGAELGVDTVLEGSVRKAGNRIRITLQLVNVATQGHIWTSSYNREVDDIFAVQSDIAERTAGALRLEFAKPGGAGSKRRPVVGPEAYDLYLKGLVAASAHGGVGMDEAVRCFERATRLDRNFAEAYAAWANLYVELAGDYVSMQAVMPRARELAAKALELDPDSSDAHASLANIAFQFDHDWTLAEAEFRTAIALNPSNVTAHRFFGLMLVALDRLDEAREQGRIQARLDPGGSPMGTLTMVEWAAGNYDLALEHLEQDLDTRAARSNHVYRGFFALAAGRRAAAVKEADMPLTGGDDSERFDHAMLNALLGRPDEARRVAAEVERREAKSYTSATHLAMLYASLGKKDRALDLLEQELRGGDRVLWLYYRGVWFDSIRDDPRFVALLREYGLPRIERRPPAKKR